MTTEAETCRKHVLPKLYAVGWDDDQIAEQRQLAAELNELQAKVERLKALQARTAIELDALLPTILDKAFKGGLQ